MKNPERLMPFGIFSVHFVIIDVLVDLGAIIIIEREVKRLAHTS